MLVNYPHNRTIFPERYQPSFPSPFCLEIKTSALNLAGLLWKVCSQSALREISTSGMTRVFLAPFPYSAPRNDVPCK